LALDPAHSFILGFRIDGDLWLAEGQLPTKSLAVVADDVVGGVLKSFVLRAKPRLPQLSSSSTILLPIIE
jgi:hypothetical protein